MRWHWQDARGIVLPAFPNFGATSVSQMAVSTASTWQKKGRMPLNLWCRQCWSRRAVSGVTCQSFGIRQLSPLVHLLAEFVDDGCGIVLLLLVGKPLAFVEDDLLLLGFCFGLSGFGDRRDEFGAAAGVDDLLCRLACASSSQWRAGYSYGELSIGRSKN